MRPLYTPHTVTIYNIARKTDPDTMAETATLYVTILRGVMLQESKGINVRESGLQGADAVNLFIPLSVEAVDGITGETKQYVVPHDFWNAADKSGIWTLSVDGSSGTTFFVKGENVTDDEAVMHAYGGCYGVTKVDFMNYGSSDMWHWEVGGV